MSNIMQYLVTLGEEFRDAYKDTDTKMQEVIQTLHLLSIRISEVEMRVNANRQEEKDDS
tara:strand:+ start:233 stop:409 length:177 start_codon:yes stop_codon:yes gene_type:complete